MIDISNIPEPKLDEEFTKMKKLLLMKYLCYHILYFNIVVGLIIYLLVMTHGDQFSTEIQALFMGGNSCIFTIAILIFNVNYVVSCIWSILYIPTVILL